MFESLTVSLLWATCTWLVANIMLGVMDALKDVNDELETKLAKRLDEIVHRVRVEKDKDTYYWYDMDNNKFLAQGSTEEELVNNLKTRYPNHMFFLPTNHLICAKTDWQPKQVGK
jgi:hypothetical protein